MTVSQDLRKGWASSLAVHLLILLILMMVDVPSLARKSEFIEVAWGSLGSTGTTEPLPEVVQKQTSPSKPSTALKAVQSKKQASQPVVLPERKLPSLSDEPLSVSREKRLETFEPVSRTRNTAKEMSETRDRSAAVKGDSDKDAPGGGIGSGVGGVREDGSDVEGSDVDRDIGFSVQWKEGGTRKKLSGNLPRYPEGVNLEAQIKILTIVGPNGNVKAVQPAQKADTRLEDAAMKEVKFWKFEPLKPDRPQIDQSCVVTFLFRLR